ncbi:mRNA-degrading endonuclease RelE of RelBE toxin-antitoxin system [Methanofollis sp. W23]|nr:mRNA-degrading endonuclease RelE of RelBE toxin-antitoxin system [Methanofollis sp. W23]
MSRSWDKTIRKQMKNLDLDARNRRSDYGDFDDEFDPYDYVEKKRKRR